MFLSWQGERHCFLEVVLEEVTFGLGFETHGGLPGARGLGEHGKWLLPEDFKSRAVWASCMHWLPGMENKQKWRRAPSVDGRQDQHSGVRELCHSAFNGGGGGRGK